MKFVYQYRSSDNVRHVGEISARDRDAAFAALKNAGIRPFAVDLAPGILNRLLGFGKLRLSLIAMVIALLAALVVLVNSDDGREELSDSLYSPARRQIIGDSAVIEFGIRTGWANVFSEDGEQFLASFAIPGMPAGRRNVGEKELAKALKRSVPVDKSDSIEAIQIKSIVSGMKTELSGLLAKDWTLTEIGSALARRQDAEIGYYNRAKSELEAIAESGAAEKDVFALWSERNDQLRRMGVRLLPMPGESQQ